MRQFQKQNSDKHKNNVDKKERVFSRMLLLNCCFVIMSSSTIAHPAAMDMARRLLRDHVYDVNELQDKSSWRSKSKWLKTLYNLSLVKVDCTCYLAIYGLHDWYRLSSRAADNYGRANYCMMWGRYGCLSTDNDLIEMKRMQRITEKLFMWILKS